MSKCGIFAKSATTYSPAIFFPNPTGRAAFEFLNSSEAITDRMDTTSLWAFGTSIPIVPFPGIGAIIRIPSAAKLKAISSSRFLIFEMRTPFVGTISYNVTVGPTVARIDSISIL